MGAEGLQGSLPELAQLGLGYEPFDAGLVMVPWALGIAIGAVISGAWAGPRFGRHVLHAGLVVLVVGVVGLGWTVSHFGLGIGGWDFVPSLLVAGIGCGLIFAPLFDLILADIDENEVGTGSGLLNALQQFGGAIGVAVLGTVLFQLLPDHGWISATRTVIWVSVGCFAASFLVAFFLPMKAREGELAH